MSNDAGDPQRGPSNAECEHVLERIYSFLDHELDTASSDEIRLHLNECEPCLDRFDLEQAVKTVVHRSCGGDRAPDHLRVKVMVKIQEIRRTL